MDSSNEKQDDSTEALDAPDSTIRENIAAENARSEVRV